MKAKKTDSRGKHVWAAFLLGAMTFDMVSQHWSQDAARSGLVSVVVFWILGSMAWSIIKPLFDPNHWWMQ